MISGIYKITNSITNIFYIGSAINIERRFGEHKKHLRHNKHNNKYLQSSWNKHWEHNFEFEIIEICEPSQLLKREQFYLDTLKPEYNLQITAGSNFGRKFSEKFKARRKEIQTGKKLSIKTRAKMSASQKARKRHPDIGKKISAAKKGKGVGRKLSEETKSKMKLAQIKRRDLEFSKNVISVLEI